MIKAGDIDKAIYLILSGKIRIMKGINMEKKPTMENTETKTLNISLRKELIKRVEVFCAEKNITVRDFVTDAIIEKIELAYKERRKKSRL